MLTALLQIGTAETLDVPFVRQQKQGCGPAVLSMLIGYWSEHGSPTTTRWTPSALYTRLYDSKIHGVTGESMLAFLREQNYNAFSFRGEWNDLSSNTNLGRPVIVALEPKSGEPIHFVLVIGTNSDSEVVIHDPDRAAYVKEPSGRFMQQWNRTDRWTLVAVPRARTEPPEQ